MSPYTFAFWLVVAVGTLVAAVSVNLDRPGPASVRLENEVAFPELRESPDAVQRVVIESGGKGFSLVRREDGTWVTPEKDNYTVEPADIRGLIVGFSDMRLVEPKTTREDRFARLEVENPASEDSSSRLVRLEGADGEVLVEVIVGKARGRFTGGIEGGTYIRRPGEDQAWLASGRVEVESDLEGWLNKDLMHFATESMRRVEVDPPEGQRIVLDRSSADEAFTLDALPEDRQVEPSQVSRLASGLSFLAFDDVAPRERFQLPSDRYRATYTAFDGVQVTVQMGPIDDDDWALFSARHVAPEGQSQEEAAAARRRAEEIAARVEGWIYKLPSHVAARLKLPYDKLHGPKGTS